MFRALGDAPPVCAGLRAERTPWSIRERSGRTIERHCWTRTSVPLGVTAVVWRQTVGGINRCQANSTLYAATWNGINCCRRSPSGSG